MASLSRNSLLVVLSLCLLITFSNVAEVCKFTYMYVLAFSAYKSCHQYSCKRASSNLFFLSDSFNRSMVPSSVLQVYIYIMLALLGFFFPFKQDYNLREMWILTSLVGKNI
jgi:hypothetical protein